MNRSETNTAPKSRFTTNETVPRDGFTIDTSKSVPDVDTKALEKQGFESIVAEFGVEGATFALATAIKRRKGESGLRLVDGKNPRKSFPVEPGSIIQLPKGAGIVTFDETRGVTVEPLSSKQDLRMTGNVIGIPHRVAFDSPIVR